MRVVGRQAASSEPLGPPFAFLFVSKTTLLKHSLFVRGPLNHFGFMLGFVIRASLLHVDSFGFMFLDLWH